MTDAEERAFEERAECEGRALEERARLHRERRAQEAAALAKFG